MLMHLLLCLLLLYIDVKCLQTARGVQRSGAVHMLQLVQRAAALAG
jgi:hypothetical protein